MLKYIAVLLLTIGVLQMSFGQYMWEPDTRLTDNDSVSYFGFPTLWSIATDKNGGVHVVWEDNRDPQWCTEVYYKRSTDNGITWEPDIPLTTNSSYWQEMPCVVVDKQGRVHTIFTEYNYHTLYPPVHYKCSTDGGDTWRPQITIVYPNGDFSGHTSLASDLEDGVYVLYASRTGGGIYDSLDNFFIRSTDGGLTWCSNIRLTSSKRALWGSVAADTLGRVHVAYVEAVTTARQLYYRRSTNMGQDFEPPVQLTTAFSNKGNGSIYTDRADKVHVVWQDDRDGNWEIYYLRSTDGGTTWNTEIRLTRDPYYSVEPNITADGNDGVYVVWTDNQAEKGVYFKSSVDGGNSWSDDTCLTLNAVPNLDYFHPNITCNDSGTYLHVAWQDARDGNPEVYYKRRITEGSISEGIIGAVGRIIKGFHPNPFTTHIGLSLTRPAGTSYELKIYDIAGRFLDSSVLKMGTRDFSWDLRNLGSGVYFLKIEGDNKKEIYKLVKTK